MLGTKPSKVTPSSNGTVMEKRNLQEYDNTTEIDNCNVNTSRSSP